MLSVPQPQDWPPIFGEKEELNPKLQNLGGQQQEGGGDLVRYNNKVRNKLFL